MKFSSSSLLRTLSAQILLPLRSKFSASLMPPLSLSQCQMEKASSVVRKFAAHAITKCLSMIHGSQRYSLLSAP